MNSPPSFSSTRDANPSAHLELVRLLQQHCGYSQRQSVVELGISLGHTQYLLKVSLGKG